MNNQNQTAVQWLIKNLIDEGELMISIRITELISKAEEMESKKQHKYDEMLEMLNRIRLGELPEQELRQLIKEATILP
jgi:hypothetical protein